MTLSKRQNRIIWGTVIIVVFLLGLTYSQKDPLKYGQPTIRTTYFYWIELEQQRRPWDDLTQAAIQRKSESLLLPEGGFFYVLAKNKILGIIAIVIIGAAALITSKKK
jgi:hypothetical protein